MSKEKDVRHRKRLLVLRFQDKTKDEETHEAMSRMRAAGFQSPHPSSAGAEKGIRALDK